MPRRARTPRDPGKFLSRLSKNLKLKKQKPEKCDECGGILDLGRGYGYCYSCYLTTPLPIGRVVSKGAHFGKFVYLKRALLRELSEDYDGSDIEEALEEELRNREFIVIEELDS